MTRSSRRPQPSQRFLLIAVVCAGLLVLAAGALIGLLLTQSPPGGAGSRLADMIGGKFELIDQNGRPFTDADLKGKWHLVFFGYTHCPDVCPTALNDLSLAMDKLAPAARAKMSIVFISVDPERDTPAVLKDYAAAFDAPIVALTGNVDQVAQAAKDYRVYFAKHARADGGYDMDHSALIYVMNPQGRFTATFTPDNTPDQIAERLRKLVS